MAGLDARTRGPNQLRKMRVPEDRVLTEQGGAAFDA